MSYEATMLQVNPRDRNCALQDMISRLPQCLKKLETYIYMSVNNVNGIIKVSWNSIPQALYTMNKYTSQLQDDTNAIEQL